MSGITWSTVALATGPAAITGALGYIGARLQYRAARVPLEQQAAEHREEDRVRRATTYHDLLDATRRLDLMLTLPSTTIDYQTWWDAWHHAVNGVYLYGTPNVREATERMNEVFSSVANEPEPVTTYRKTRIERYLPAYDALTASMRDDISQ